MNFLGHFYLSKNNTGLILGNYIADFVKGKNYGLYPDEIARGILLHRQIDDFTDRHAMVRKGRKRLFEKYRHFGGIIIDMYYDHYLASRWPEYSESSLLDFSAYIYQIIEENLSALPSQSQFMFPYMKNGNWLIRYSTMEGLHKSLRGMASRINHPSKLEQANEELQLYYAEYYEEFTVFMDDLIRNFGGKEG